MTNPSLATMIHEAQRAEEDARAVGMRDYAPDKWVTITSRLYALRRLASLCRRACDDDFAAFCDARSDDAREHQDAAAVAAEVSL